jgi:hypothetical protein
VVRTIFSGSDYQLEERRKAVDDAIREYTSRPWRLNWGSELGESRGSLKDREKDEEYYFWFGYLFFV